MIFEQHYQYPIWNIDCLTNDKYGRRVVVIERKNKKGKIVAKRNVYINDMFCTAFGVVDRCLGKPYDDWTTTSDEYTRKKWKEEIADEKDGYYNPIYSIQFIKRKWVICTNITDTTNHFSTSTKMDW